MLRQLAPSAGAGETGGTALLRQLLRALDGRYPSSLDAAINAVLSKGPEQQQEAALVGSQALQKPLSEEAVRGLQDCLREALAGSMRQPLSASSQTMAVALDSPAAEMRILVSHQSLHGSAHGTSPALQAPAGRQGLAFCLHLHLGQISALCRRDLVVGAERHVVLASVSAKPQCCGPHWRSVLQTIEGMPCVSAVAGRAQEPTDAAGSGRVRGPPPGCSSAP